VSPLEDETSLRGNEAEDYPLEIGGFLVLGTNTHRPSVIRGLNRSYERTGIV
jgi:hypothetical protein